MADEVRKLAEKTQKSLSEIDATINIIVQSILNANNDMHQNIKNVENVTQKTKQAQREIKDVSLKMQEAVEKVEINVTNLNKITKQMELFLEEMNEIEKSFGKKLKSEKEVADFMKELYGKGVRLSFLTNGADYLYASKFDFHYRVKPPAIKEIDAVGSGDAFTAGVIYGLEKSFVFKDMLKFGTVLGALNASETKTCLVAKNEAEKIAGDISTEEIGKKMKIIDDSPNY